MIGYSKRKQQAPVTPEVQIDTINISSLIATSLLLSSAVLLSLIFKYPELTAPSLDILDRDSSTGLAQEYILDLDGLSNLLSVKRVKIASAKVSSIPSQSLLLAPLQEHKEKVERLQWEYIIEEALFNTLLDIDCAGKCADSGWKSEAWVEVFNAVQTVTPDQQRAQLTMDKLKSKKQNYKSLYKD